MDRRSATLALLTRHRPADAQEAEFLRRMLDLGASAGDPFSRAFFQPGHFTASAFVLAPEGDELLLILHGKLHRWLQPGGHIDPEDADPLAGARREVAEEVGLSELEVVGAGLFDVDVHEIPAMKGHPAHEHHDLRFLFRSRTREARAGSDAKAARWVPLDAVNEVESDRSVMRAVEKLRGG